MPSPLGFLPYNQYSYYPGNSGYSAMQGSSSPPSITASSMRSPFYQDQVQSPYSAGRGGYASGSPYGGFGSRPAGLGVVPPAATNPFTTLNNVKSPQIQGVVNSGLSTAASTNFDPNVNPNVLRDTVKNPTIGAAVASSLQNLNSSANPRDFQKSAQFQGGIDQGFQQAQQDRATNQQQFGQFKQLFDSATPGVTGNVGQENAAIGQVYNGGLQSTLDAQAAARARAVNLAGNRALGAVQKNYNLGAMVNGGGSYLQQQALDTSAGIYADEARQQADLARANSQYVLGAQGQYLGARNAGNDYLVNRQMQPANFLNQLGAAADSRLGNLGAMDLSNNTYTTPQEQAAHRAAMLAQLTGIDNNNNFYSTDSLQNNLGRQAGLYNQFQGLNNNNNFYGLSQPYNQNTTGYFGGTGGSFGGGIGNGNSGSGGGFTYSPQRGNGYSSLGRTNSSYDPNSYSPGMVQALTNASNRGPGYDYRQPQAFNPTTGYGNQGYVGDISGGGNLSLLTGNGAPFNYSDPSLKNDGSGLYIPGYDPVAIARQQLLYQ